VMMSLPVVHDNVVAAEGLVHIDRWMGWNVEREQREADLLQVFVPPSISEADIDRVLREVFSEQNVIPGKGNSRKALGTVFKAFYAKVDRSSVDSELVRIRAETLLTESQPN